MEVYVTDWLHSLAIDIYKEVCFEVERRFDYHFLMQRKKAKLRVRYLAVSCEEPKRPILNSSEWQWKIWIIEEGRENNYYFKIFLQKIRQKFLICRVYIICRLFLLKISRTFMSKPELSKLLEYMIFEKPKFWQNLPVLWQIVIKNFKLSRKIIFRGMSRRYMQFKLSVSFVYITWVNNSPY